MHDRDPMPTRLQRCPIWVKSRHSQRMSALPPKADIRQCKTVAAKAKKADMVFGKKAYSRFLRWAKYFSYSAREITPPSCLTRARSLAGSEACISSTRFQGASGVSHVERGTYSDGLVFV
jgi:hypothetical protein